MYLQSDSVYLLDLSEDFFYDRYVKRMEISKEMQVGTSFKLQVAQVSALEGSATQSMWFAYFCTRFLIRTNSGSFDM